MGLLITGIIFILFLKYIQTKDGDTQRAMLSSFVILFIFSLLLNWYMEYIIGWEYGIPGVDLRSFFDAAQALSDGTKITELGPIRFCFEWKLSNVGYILYVVLIYLIVFIPTIISVRFSLQLIYMIQIIVAIIACNNICNFFVKNEIKQKRYIYLIMILNIGIMQQSSILMRDIWIVFFISLLMKECGKKKSSFIRCLVFIISAFVLRSYSVIITIPIFIAYGLKKKKLAVICGLSFFAILFVGANVINLLADYFSVKWKYDFNYSLKEMFLWVISPNPINQAKIIRNGSELFYHSVFGGNCAWVYFLLACWNIAIYPIAIYGIGIKIKKGIDCEFVLWFLAVANILMIYNVFYDSVSEPRHKIMVLYSIIYFINEATQGKSIKTRIIYGICMIVLFFAIIVRFIIL